MPVELVLSEEFAVFAGGFDSAFVKQENTIAGPNRRGAMGQENHRSARKDPRKRVVEERFEVVV